ncbi:MAG: 30S ribosomal protein S9 [Patescibacteria group bacterium]
MPPKKPPIKKSAVPKEKPVAAAKEIRQPADRAGKYFEAVGRRKTSVARVRLYPAAKRAFTVNGKGGEKYFPTLELQKILHDPFERAPVSQQFEVTVKVHGGGVHSQAEAVRHGITRAVLKYDGELRKTLKPWGFITRDPRMKERRKFGLKKARKAPQWAKR